MKTFKEASRSKKFIYGIMKITVSITALILIFAAKDGVLKEHDDLWEKEVCFRTVEEIEKSGIDPEDQKSINRECMSIRNKVYQIRYGTPVFILILIFGIIMLLASFVEIKSSADKALEDFEKEEDENDNKLS
jgi:hypothetical protein